MDKKPMSECEICGRELADTYVSPPAGMCSIRWPSSETEHWRLGYKRERRRAESAEKELLSTRASLTTAEKERDQWRKDCEDYAGCVSRLESSRDQMGAALREALRAARCDVGHEEAALDRVYEIARLALASGAPFGESLAETNTRLKEELREAKDRILEGVAEWDKERAAHVSTEALNTAIKEALSDANGMCRSAYQIAARRGQETNWDAWTARLDESLKRQHAIMYPAVGTPPPLPQPWPVDRAEKEGDG